MTDQELSGLRSYQTFVLRIWLEEHQQQKRVLLLDTNTGERWIFTEFQALSDHLQRKVDSGS